MSLDPLTLKGKELEAFRRGFYDGNESNYFPCGLSGKAYDAGFKAGQKFGDRKGRPWTLEELLKLARRT